MNISLPIFILLILTFSLINSIAIDDYHCKVPTCRDFHCKVPTCRDFHYVSLIISLNNHLFDFYNMIGSSKISTSQTLC
jgi:hypothetical protein